MYLLGQPKAFLMDLRKVNLFKWNEKPRFAWISVPNCHVTGMSHILVKRAIAAVAKFAKPRQIKDSWGKTLPRRKPLPEFRLLPPPNPRGIFFGAFNPISTATQFLLHPGNPATAAPDVEPPTRGRNNPLVPSKTNIAPHPPV